MGDLKLSNRQSSQDNGDLVLPAIIFKWAESFTYGGAAWQRPTRQC